MTVVPFDYYVGLDLGQLNDFTACCVLEEPVWLPAGPEPFACGLAPTTAGGWTPLDALTPLQRGHWREQGERTRRPPDPPLLLRHLERVRGVPYPQIVRRVQQLVTAPPLAETHVALVVDATGVGRGVTDLLAAQGLTPVNLTITGGTAVHADRGCRELHVPKRELVVAAQLALQRRRLRVAPALEHAPTLVAELKDYQVKVSPSGHDSYTAREGQHDDLVLSVAMAVWFRGWYCWHLDERHRAGPREPVEVVG